MIITTTTTTITTTTITIITIITIIITITIIIIIIIIIIITIIIIIIIIIITITITIIIIIIIIITITIIINRLSSYHEFSPRSGWLGRVRGRRRGSGLLISPRPGVNVHPLYDVNFNYCQTMGYWQREDQERCEIAGKLIDIVAFMGQTHINQFDLHFFKFI